MHEIASRHRQRYQLLPRVTRKPPSPAPETHMVRPFDKHTLAIVCPRCSHKTLKTIGWVKAHSQFTCTCGTMVSLDAEAFRQSIVECERALAHMLTPR
jgi:transposase-like protein